MFWKKNKVNLLKGGEIVELTGDPAWLIEHKARQKLINRAIIAVLIEVIIALSIYFSLKLYQSIVWTLLMSFILIIILAIQVYVS
jgi:hypothetical protein